MRRRKNLRLMVMLIAGVAATIITGAFGKWTYAPTVGWCVSAAIYSSWVWIAIRSKDAAATKRNAGSEEPSRSIADILVVILSVASLFSVAYVLVQAGSAHGIAKLLLALLALVSVALSWFLLHTLFTLRYAELYYLKSGGGGVNFNQKEDPQYTDFAYLAFVLGMTFQVSDTNITNHRMRTTVLRHSLLSFLFGSVILASTVNLIAGLSG